MIVGEPVQLTGIQVAEPVVLQSISVGSVIPGGSGAGSYTYVHTQVTPATVWTVNHNLGHRPASVTVFSSDYSTQWDEFGIQHITANTLYITTDVAITGVALVR